MNEKYVSVPHATLCLVCQDCGSLVLNVEIHDKFHDALGNVSRMASNADMMWRPIG